MKTELIERILNSGRRAVLVTTGGGSSALNALLTTPGASRFVIEAHVPYSPEALERFLGENPEQSVSPETARKLAKVGQASCLSGQAGSLSYTMGISCTAALQTDRERRGEDRAFICIKTAEAEKVYALYFSKTSRAEQEALLSDWLLTLISYSVGAERGLMLPGSFNPIHQGHRNLLKVAEEMTGLRGVFELSCANVDKPAIEEADGLRRAAAIKDVPVALTHAPRFIQKAQLFPKTTFAVGFDTAIRFVKDYSPEEWAKFKTLETRFLVAGRQFDGVFQTLENLDLPQGFEPLFENIPESKFRADISSTELRTP
jgi:nicotinamide mononucleotide (NMN) deamidase PncC